MKIIFFLIPFILSFCVNAQNGITEKYYRHLRYNHVSPHVPFKGILEINKEEATSTSHYIFKYSEDNKLKEIINNHYHTEKKHPLASIGAYRTIFSYAGEFETRIFLDKNGKKIVNDREVYKEVFRYDKSGFREELRFYDQQNSPMESIWGIAYYKWEKYKNMVVEKRFNLKNEFRKLSPYFDFDITGIVYTKNGFPKANYNLNDKYKINDNALGIASYKDSYNKNGSHIKYSYHNKENKLVKNQWQFAIGEKVYDKYGNNIKIVYYDEDNILLNERIVYSNVAIEMANLATKEDSLEIKRKSIGYIKSLQNLNPLLMDSVLDSIFTKVTIGYNPLKRSEIIKETTREQMIEFATNWNRSGQKFPLKPVENVTILDVYNQIATVKLVSDNWVEYLQLIKTNGKWSITNMIWQYKDLKKYIH